MDNQIPEDPYRILARERSHEDARQTVATNRMLVQSLVVINGGAATVALASYGAHNAPARVSPRLFLQAAIENEVIDYIQFHKDRRDENGQWSVVRKSLSAILRASHRAHCVDHLGVKRGETIRNMGVESDTRFTSITRVYLGRALGAHQHDVGVHPKER